MGKGFEQKFLHIRHIYSQKAYEKMFIISHQGNTNQNHNEMLSYIHQNKKATIKRCHIVFLIAPLIKNKRWKTYKYPHKTDEYNVVYPKTTPALTFFKKKKIDI